MLIIGKTVKTIWEYCNFSVLLKIKLFVKFLIKNFTKEVFFLKKNKMYILSEGNIVIFI